MMGGHEKKRRGLGRGSLTRVKTRNGDRIWRGDFVDADGTRRRVLLSRDKRISEQRLKELIRKRDEIIDGLRPHLAVDLEILMERYLEVLHLHRKPSYIEKLEQTLPRVIRELGAKTAEQVTGERLTTYQLKRTSDGRANATVNRELSALRGMLTWAFRQGRIGANPMLGFPRLPEGEDDVVKPRRAFDADEVSRFLDAAGEIDFSNAAYRAARKSIEGGTKGKEFAERVRYGTVPQTPLFRAMLLTGMRLGEARSLRWSDVDLVEGLITVRAENAKSRRKRIIPIHDILKADLQSLLKIHEHLLDGDFELGGRVFLPPSGHGVLDQANCSRLFKRILKHADIEKVKKGASLTIHSLRHTFCTMLAQARVPLIEAQKLMGHSDPKLTARIYSHIDAQDLRPAINRLSIGGEGEAKEDEVGYSPLAIFQWLRRRLAG